jgi:hypothetical protein
MPRSRCAWETITLAQAWGRADRLKEEFKLRRERFEQLLAELRIANPNAIEKATHERFQRWWIGTLLAYIALVAAGVIAVCAAPGPLEPLTTAGTPTVVATQPTPSPTP